MFRNLDGVDILVSNIEGNKLFSIQVKTTQNKRKWILNKKIENEKSENKYFAFVNIPQNLDIQPEYFIIKSQTLAEHIFNGHSRWLSGTGKNPKGNIDKFLYFI